jgi:hypothetical protein
LCLQIEFVDTLESACWLTVNAMLSCYVRRCVFFNILIAQTGYTTRVRTSYTIAQTGYTTRVRTSYTIAQTGYTTRVRTSYTIVPLTNLKENSHNDISVTELNL